MARKQARKAKAAPAELPPDQRCYLVDHRGDFTQFDLVDLPDALLPFEQQLREGRPLGLERPLQLRLEKGTKLGDFVSTACRRADFPQPLLVSRRLAELFARHCPQGLELVPVSWVDAKGRVVRDDYVLANPLVTADVLDERASSVFFLWRSELTEAATIPARVMAAPQLFRFAGAESPQYGIRYELARAINEGEISNFFWKKLSPATPELNLAAAIVAGDVEEARRLLDAGADPDLVIGDLPALARAADKGDVALCRLLLERGADVNAAGERGGALEYALWRGAEVTRLLLEAGAKVVSKDEPFRACADPATVQLLLDAGFDPKKRFIKRGIQEFLSDDTDEEQQKHLAMVLRAVLPAAGALAKDIEDVLSAQQGGDAGLSKARKAKRPSLSKAAAEAGTEAGQRAELDLDPDGEVGAQLEELADSAWEHDGVPHLEGLFPDKSIHGSATSAAYTKAFLAEARKRMGKRS